MNYFPYDNANNNVSLLLIIHLLYPEVFSSLSINHYKTPQEGY